MPRITQILFVLFFVGMAAPLEAHSVDQSLKGAAKNWLAVTQQKGFTFSESERRNWHYTPRSRQGLMIGDMNDAQKQATTALMRATLSSAGMLKVKDIMRLEAVLAEIEGSSLSYRNPEGYFVSIFGEPDVYPWGWRLEGHHLSINVTVSTANNISLTPLFTGTNPARPPAGAVVSRPIQYDEMILAARLIQTLTPEQARLAKMERSPREIVTGPGRGDAIKESVGVPAGTLNVGQRDLLRNLISSYVGVVQDAFGQKYMSLIDAGLDKTVFAWAGEASERAAFYYRIHGPRILIEFDNTRGGDHIHAIWRDPLDDFGRDTLREHYANGPHQHDDWP